MAPPSIYSTTVDSSPQQEQLPYGGGDCRNQHAAEPPAPAMTTPSPAMALEGTVAHQALPKPSPPPKPTIQVRVPAPSSLALATSPAYPSTEPRPGKRRPGRPRNPPDLASNPKLYPTKGYIWSDDEGANEEDFKSKKTYKRGGDNAQNSAEEDVAEDRGVEDKETNGHAENDNAGGGSSPEF